MNNALTQLTLVTPPRLDPSGFAPRLNEALGAAEVAAVILDLAEDDDRAWRAAAEVLRPIAQQHGAAFILRDHRQLAGAVGADGVHVSEGATALAETIKTLKPQLIVGAGDCTTRHAAMTLGERAPDYVFLGRLDGGEDTPASRTLVEWWVGLFEVPCVALAADEWASAEDVIRAGADFLALRDLVWLHQQGPAAAVRQASTMAAELPEMVA